jgi:cytoplasmic iron level regulating protein YaaA (DUF328/UPF0246 family)
LSHITLISCCGLKLQDPAPARELYQSTLFKKNLAYAERTSDQVFILSAKLGLVKLDEVIEPYDFTLTQATRSFKRSWGASVAEQLFKELEADDTIQVLAGRSYRDPLFEHIATAWVIDVPMAGMGIGQQLGWLTDQLKLLEGSE